MEVDTDDDLIETTNLNRNGPLPDVTHNLPVMKHQKSPLLHKEIVEATGSSKYGRAKGGTGRGSENQPLLLNSSSGNVSDDQMDASDFVHLSCNHFESDPEFNEIVKKVEFAIDHNILPQRIYEGSSGSYFCRNTDNVFNFDYSLLK